MGKIVYKGKEWKPEDQRALQSIQPVTHTSIFDRTLGMTIIGQTGMGKTAFLHNLIMEDIQEGRSSIVIDPHGDLSTDILESVDKDHAKNIYILEVSEDMPFGLNLYQCDNPKSSLVRTRTVDNAIRIFKRLIQDERGYHPHIETLFRSLGETLLANPEYTLAEAWLMFELSDRGKAFRSHLLKNISSPMIHSFWKGVEERSKTTAYQYIEPLLNKVSPFIASEPLNLIVGQTQTSINFSDFLDQPGKTLIISLPIGILGEEKTQMLGMVLLSLLSEQIYERVNQQKESRTLINLYIDEAGLFFSSGTAISKLLKQGRKFGCATHLSFQTLADLPDREAQSAVLQTGTLVFFQVIGGTDAEILSKQLQVKQPPVEQVPKMRMEPNIKQWDEEVWIDEKAKEADEHSGVGLEQYIASIQEKLANLYTLENCFRLACSDTDLPGMITTYSFSDLVHPGKKSLFSPPLDVYQKVFVLENGEPRIVRVLKRCCADLQSGEGERFDWLANSIYHKGSDLHCENLIGKTNPQTVIKCLQWLILVLSTIPPIHRETFLKNFAAEESQKFDEYRAERDRMITEYWEHHAKLKREYYKVVHHVEQDGWVPVKTEEVRVPTQIQNYSRRGPAYFQGSSVLQREQQIYDMVDGTPRPFSDLWNELQGNLATLPLYHYYMQTINEQKEIIDSQHKSAEPPKAQEYGQEQAEEIRVRSLMQFGRPAEVVRKNLTDRVVPFLSQPEQPEQTPLPESNQPRQQRSRTKKLEI